MKGVIVIYALYMSFDTDLNTADDITSTHWVFIVCEQVFCFYFTLELFIRFMAFERKLGLRCWLDSDEEGNLTGRPRKCFDIRAQPSGTKATVILRTKLKRNRPRPPLDKTGNILKRKQQPGQLRKCNCFKDAWFVFDFSLVFMMIAETWATSPDV